MKGLVMRSTGSWYEVRLENSTVLPCRTRGKLRLEGYKESNPIAVGDYVAVETGSGEGIITSIFERKNHIVRQSVKKTGHTSVLAANVDQVLVLATLKQPRTSLGFIDRVLVAAEAFRIPQLIIFNKKDLLTTADLSELDVLTRLYLGIGATVLSISAGQDPDVGKVYSLLESKVTLVTGHSGVGKSTLLNKLLPQLKLATGAISDYSEKGTHTTTFAEMFQMNETTFIIDTPGIKEWGLADMAPQEISDYFPEMRDLRMTCKFGSRCLHLHEPKCAVLAAVENGTIATSRYHSYVSMVTGEDTRK